MALWPFFIGLAVVSCAAVNPETATDLEIHDAQLSLAQIDARVLRAQAVDNGDAPSVKAAAVKVGETAPLSEAGYQLVAAKAKSLRRREVMSTFVRRICQQEGLRIVDKVALRAFERYFDGECGTQSFGALAAGLHEALRKPAACGGGWVARGNTTAAGTRKFTQAKSTGALLELTSNLRTRAVATAVLRNVRALQTKPNVTGPWQGYWAIVPHKDERAMNTFIRGTIALLGGEVLNEGDLSGFVHWYSGAGPTQSYHRLVQELREIGDQPHSWIKFHKVKNPIKKADISQRATLDEDGYRQVAATNDHHKMGLYIHRVAKEEGLQITNEADVQGMIPWYTSDCGPQSYAALRDELRRSVQPPPSPAADGVPESNECGGWLVPSEA